MKDESIFQPRHDKRGVYNSKKKETAKRNERIKRAGQKDKEPNPFLTKLDQWWTNNKVLGYLILYFVWPALLVFLFECLNNRSFYGAIVFVTTYTWAYLCNVLMVSASFSLAMLIRKRVICIFAISVFWTFWAFTNYVLLCNRVTPLTGNDFALITDMFGVVFKYLSVPAAIALIILVIAVIVGIIFLFIKAPVLKKSVNYLVSFIAIVFMFSIMFGAIEIGLTTGAVETQFHELSQSYKRNGFLYCFVNSLTDVGVSKPSDYSADAIETLVDDSSDTTTDESEDKEILDANVIVVQLESFFDVSRLKNVEFSKNPLPNFTKLCKSKKSASGFFGVPVIGAGTVNSEFEVLTGMNIDDFGAGEYPYKTILRKTTCESIAYDLAQNGLATHAIHNHTGTFYGRNNIYKNVGFDTFTSVEYMRPKAYTGLNWAKDSVLTTEIEKALGSTAEKDFVFAVSVQGHGKYPDDNSVSYKEHVTVTSDTYDEAYMNQVNYYVNQLYEMDQFIGALWKYVKSLDEPTILVFYGDHMPSLDITADSLTSGTEYQTEYVIWNNMGLAFTDEDLEAYQIGSRIMNAMNIDDGVINAYHQSSQTALDAGEIKQEEYLEGLQSLEYDILYGDKVCYNGTNPYTATDMTMGIDPIVITKVQNTNTDRVIIRGANFTRYSKVYVNEEEQKTYFYDADKLVIKGIELKPGDVVEVWQRTLSSTDPFVFEAEKVEETESETETTKTDDDINTKKNSKSSSSKTTNQ